MTPERELRECLDKFLQACLELDAIGELDERFPGELMDEAQKLLAAAPAPTPAPPTDAFEGLKRSREPVPTKPIESLVPPAEPVVLCEFHEKLIANCKDCKLPAEPAVPEWEPHEPRLWAVDGPVTGKEGK